MLKKYLPQIIILSIILVLYGFFITEKIDLTTADLGRHIKNGEIILTNFNYNVFNTNFYSFNYPDFPFVNHHWGSGVIFFLVWKMFGFIGLSLFYLIISLFTLALFFSLARKMSNTTIAFLVSLLLIPFIADRKEIRPEVFSYLFSAVFLWILWHYKNNSLSQKYLFILPFVQLIWINTHIYFFIGPFLIFLFIFEDLLKKQRNKIKKLLLSFGLTIIACFLNPLGLKVVFYPLNIFKNYGYRIIENQSVWFLDNLGIINNPNLFLIKVVSVVLILSFILILIFNRRHFSVILFGITLLFLTASWFAIRNFTILGLFALPTIAYNLKLGFNKKFRINPQTTDALIVILVIILIVFGIVNNYSHITNASKKFGIGTMPKNNVSAEFFIKEKIKGPIFNNYDIGSYLIFHFFPEEKVFVDNRPEVYPVSFFKEIYIPMQENNIVWDEQNKKHDFNVIFFAYHDATPWAQNFLITRVNDPEWAPVFADNYAIIFLKRNDLNKELIEKYEIPKDVFSVTRAQ